MVTPQDVAEPATADNVETFTDLRGWMAALALLKDRGYCENVTFGDDEDSRQLVRDARRANQGWEPGSPVKVPARSSLAPSPSAAQPSTVAAPMRQRGSREQRPQRHRGSSSAAASHDGPRRPDDEPEPPPLGARACVCGCGQSFISTNPRKQYHSAACRQAASRNGGWPDGFIVAERELVGLVARSQSAPDEALLRIVNAWPVAA